MSYHNDTIAVGTYHWDIIILDAIAGSQTAVLSGHMERVLSLMFLSNGTSLVSGSGDCTVKLWDVQIGGVVKTFSGHTNWVYSVSISADCTRIASGSYDGIICLWDIQTGDCYHTIQQPSIVFHVYFSPTHPQHIFSDSNGKIWQWDINGHQIKPPFDGYDITSSSDGTQFVSCYKQVVTVQNSDSGVNVTKFHITNSYIGNCCFSPDSRLIAGTKGNTVFVWNITNSDPCLVGTFTGHIQPIPSLAFSSPSSLITASLDGSVKVWQIGTPSADPVVADLGSTSIISAPIQSIALQVEDGIIITSDSDGIVKTWDISTGLCKASYQTPAKGTCCRDVQLIDSRLVCVWETDVGIQMWDTEKGKLWEVNDELLETTDLKISWSESKVFCLNPSSIKLYSMQTGELVDSRWMGVTPDHKSLIVDGLRVWVYSLDLFYDGWDFGIHGQPSIQLPPHRLHSSGAMLWDIRQSRIKDQTTGKVVFQLSRFTNPVDVQWDGQYLVLCYTHKDVLILDFSHLFLQ